MLFKRRKDDTLSPVEAAERLQRGEIVLVDVREPAEWRQARPNGARHIPLGELPSRAGELPGDRPVAFVCASGSRSKMATRIAARHGLEALNVEGGLLAWRRARLPLTAG